MFMLFDVSKGNNNFKGRPIIRRDGNITFADLICPSKLVGKSTILPYFQHPRGKSSLIRTTSPMTGVASDL